MGKVLREIINPWLHLKLNCKEMIPEGEGHSRSKPKGQAGRQQPSRFFRMWGKGRTNDYLSLWNACLSDRPKTTECSGKILIFYLGSKVGLNASKVQCFLLCLHLLCGQLGPMLYKAGISNLCIFSSLLFSPQIFTKSFHKLNPLVPQICSWLHLEITVLPTYKSWFDGGTYSCSGIVFFMPIGDKDKHLLSLLTSNEMKKEPVH